MAKLKGAKKLNGNIEINTDFDDPFAVASLVEKNQVKKNGLRSSDQTNILGVRESNLTKYTAGFDD